MDPSDQACVEHLRPKSVPEGLVALGTVLQVSEYQIKLQITGGITCLVDRLDISQPYTNLAQSSELGPPAKLSQLFERGQQYVCKIVEKRPRKGYADAEDIVASLNPSIIQEDNIPTTLLAIPQVPLQCAVQSIEDHGYQMDIGFNNLTGFLTFEDSDEYCLKNNNGNRFFIGQVVRCCLKNLLSSESDSRIVHLSLQKSDMKNSEFTLEKVSNNVITDKCILPGSKSFLTVMKVKKDGLLVNFMNEFSGFVGIHHLKDEWHTPLENYKIADRIKCSVLYYNNITKTFALTLITSSKYKKTLKCFLENYHVGKIIKKARVAFLDGTRAVNFKVDTTYKGISHVNDALEGDNNTMTKDELYLKLDSTFPDGSKHKCRIKSLNLADLIIVLSLKQEFLELPFVSIDELRPADFIEVTIKKYVKDGIVVTFGLNLRAIILNQNLHEFISSSSYKRYPIGKKIQCRVLKVDSSKHPARVYLTNKEKLMDPNLTIVDSYSKSFQGASTHATIFKISPKGLIVELFNNIKGFIPKRFLSKVPIKNINDLFKVGQETSCVVYSVDPHRPSLKLGTIDIEDILKQKREKRELNKSNKELKEIVQIDRKLDKKIDHKVNNKVDNKVDKKTDKNAEANEKQAIKRLPEPEAANIPPPIKTRRQRSEEARLREEQIREEEKRLLDPNRAPQNILDYERLVLKDPNVAEVWIKYSKFFLDSVETEKARIVCRRALGTINFRMTKEKLKIWLHMIWIEAKYGGIAAVRDIINEAVQTNDPMFLYQGASEVLTSCGELEEAEAIHGILLKKYVTDVDVWLNYLLFVMEHRKKMTLAREMFDKATKIIESRNLICLKSRFAQFEFRIGDVERGKTIFDKLLSEYPKRTDLWRVYEGMVRKFGNRQVDTIESREQNEILLQRIAESIELVSKKGRKNNLNTKEQIVQEN